MQAKKIMLICLTYPTPETISKKCFEKNWMGVSNSVIKYKTFFSLEKYIYFELEVYPVWYKYYWYAIITQLWKKNNFDKMTLNWTFDWINKGKTHYQVKLGTFAGIGTHVYNDPIANRVQ